MIGTSEKRSPDSDEIDQKIKVLIVDIEGTTTSISFVKDTLFPYIRENLRVYVKTHLKETEFVDDLVLLKKQAESDKENGVEGFIPIPTGTENEEELCEAVCNNILWQMDLDRKTKALKQLQGHVMREGYLNGKLKGHVYDDVQPALKSWTHSGRQVYVYSSGSVAAQKLLFGFSEKGDLLEFFSGHFDTEVGPKVEASSYSNIAKQLKCENEEILFLTDVPTEAKAAQAAGLQVFLVSRPGNAPLTDDDCGKFRVIKSFDDIVFGTSAKRTKLSVEENKSKPDDTKDKSSPDTPMDVDDVGSNCVKVSEGSSLATKSLDNDTKDDSSAEQAVVKSTEDKTQETDTRDKMSGVKGKNGNEVELSSHGKENGECTPEIRCKESDTKKDSVEEKVDSTSKSDSPANEMDTEDVENKDVENKAKDVTSKKVSDNLEEKSISDSSVKKSAGGENVEGADSESCKSADSDNIATSTESQKQNVDKIKMAESAINETESSDIKKAESPISEDTVNPVSDKKTVESDSKENSSAKDKIDSTVKSSTTEKAGEESTEGTNKSQQEKTDESKASEKTVETSTQEKTVETSTQEKTDETSNQEKTDETSAKEKTVESTTKETIVESCSEEKTGETSNEVKIPEASSEKKAVEVSPQETPAEASPEEKTVESSDDKVVSCSEEDKSIDSTNVEKKESPEEKTASSSDENNSKSMADTEIAGKKSDEPVAEAKQPKDKEEDNSTIDSNNSAPDSLECDSGEGKTVSNINKTEESSTNKETKIPCTEDKGDVKGKADKSETPKVDEVSAEKKSEHSENKSTESHTKIIDSSSEEKKTVKDDQPSSTDEDVKMESTDEISEPKTDKADVSAEKTEKNTETSEVNGDTKMDVIESNNISANGTEGSDSSQAEVKSKEMKTGDTSCKEVKDLHKEDSMETDCQKSDACEDTVPMDVDGVSKSEETKCKNGSNDEAQDLKIDNSKTVEAKTNGVEEKSKVDDIKVKKSSDESDSMEVVTPAQS